MFITERSKRVVPFRPGDARSLGEGCFYLDTIVWLNGDQIDLGSRVGFNYGCYVNGYGGLSVGDDTVIGPYSMIHTANHEFGDLERPITEQGWRRMPVAVGRDCWVGMGVSILPGVTVGDGCVVGAGSVVVSDLAPYSVAVGNPARVVKSRRT